MLSHCCFVVQIEAKQKLQDYRHTSCLLVQVWLLSLATIGVMWFGRVNLAYTIICSQNGLLSEFLFWKCITNLGIKLWLLEQI